MMALFLIIVILIIIHNLIRKSMRSWTVELTSGEEMLGDVTVKRGSLSRR